MIATGTGAEAYSDRLASGLIRRGHEVALEKRAQAFQYAPWLSGLQCPKDADVTVANSWTAAAFSGGAPLVTVVHHVVHSPEAAACHRLEQRIFHRALVRPMERAAIRRSRKVVAVSQTTAKDIAAQLEAGPVEVVVNGVDTDFFVPAARTTRQPSGVVKLLFVGKMSRRKGFDLVAEVLEAMGDQVNLTVIGEGLEHGLGKPPGRYLGRVTRTRLLAEYQSADFLLFPSRLEGFGYVAAEAMASGLPVLCLEGGAVAEVVNPPEAGMAVPEANARDLGSLAVEAISSPSRFEALRHSARARAVAHFAETRWVIDMESALSSAAEAAK